MNTSTTTAWILDDSVPEGIRECTIDHSDDTGYVLRYQVHGITMAVHRTRRDIFLNKAVAIAVLQSYQVKPPNSRKV